jgi:hypothetical protein
LDKLGGYRLEDRGEVDEDDILKRGYCDAAMLMISWWISAGG